MRTPRLKIANDLVSKPVWRMHTALYASQNVEIGCTLNKNTITRQTWTTHEIHDIPLKMRHQTTPQTV